MMRPVILSRPENTAVGLAILGSAAMTVSSGGGGGGAPGCWRCSGGRPACCGPAEPGGGGSGCVWMPGGGPGGRRAPGYCPRYCCDGGGPGGNRSGGGPRP